MELIRKCFSYRTNIDVVMRKINVTMPLTLQMVETVKKNYVIIQQDRAWYYTTSVTVPRKQI